MENFIIFNNILKNKLTKLRNNEIKWGERVKFPAEKESVASFLQSTNARYILIGISEDIGIRANFGRAGSTVVWNQMLSSLLNIQHNDFSNGSLVGILGHFYFSEWQEQAAALNVQNIEDRKKLFQLVQQIDKEVAYLISQICKAGKIPIIIGGGHNNAYGNIKGLALAKNTSVNVVNFDAHTDFRPLEGRHSGNGFSYALEEGFLRNYFIYGLHENYTSTAVLKSIRDHQQVIKYNTFEQIKVRKEKAFTAELHLALQHIKQHPYGIELDLDSIENINSSAVTPSGFSTSEARQFLHFMAHHPHASYLHICEGIVDDHAPAPDLTGKLITYMITDFIKSKESTKAFQK